MTETAPPPSSSSHTMDWWWAAFLVFILFQPAFTPDATVVDWLVAGGIIALYLPVYLDGIRRPPDERITSVVATLLLGVVATPFNSGASVLFVFAAAFAGSFDPPARARRWVATCFGVLALTALFSPVPFPYNLLAFGVPLVFVWFVGLTTMADAERARDAARLRVDNARIEHLATMAERERIARDLHDVLGHTLTAVVVQAQLVQRLTDHDPRRARDEAATIEASARDALAAVRATVAGYRTTSLDDELEEARVALDAAGIDLTVQVAPTDLPPAVETALAMALREAVTNVVRHARARTCRVAVATPPGAVRLEVVDDGRGGGAEGNGLRGMRERITAFGGDVRRISTDGTRLTVTVPTEVRP